MNIQEWDQKRGQTTRTVDAMSRSPDGLYQFFNRDFSVMDAPDDLPSGGTALFEPIPGSAYADAFVCARRGQE